MSADKPTSTIAEASRTHRLILVGIVMVLSLALDLWTKDWVWDNLREGRSVEVIPHVFYLKFGFNTGSAFSFLRNESWARTFFIVVTFLALGYMAWLASKMPTLKAYGFVAIGLISAGAAGNLHDRFFRTMEVFIEGEGRVERHGVVDFLQVYLNYDTGNYWPIFNVADSSLVCGVALLLIYLHRHGEVPVGSKDAKAEPEKAEPEKAELAEPVLPKPKIDAPESKIDEPEPTTDAPEPTTDEPEPDVALPVIEAT